MTDVIAVNELGDSLSIATQFDSIKVVEFCDSRAMESDSAWIHGVCFKASCFFTSNNGGYLDYGNTGYFMRGGNSYNMRFSPGFPGVSKDVHWRVWIDLNRDGDFEDPFELAVEETTKKKFLTQVQLPMQVNPGMTTMRVQMALADGAYPEACEDVMYGEVEDYTYEIRPPLPSSGGLRNLPVNMEFMPNPVVDFGELWLYPDEYTGSAEVEVRDIAGKLISSSFISLEEGISFMHRISFEDFTPGIYLVRVQGSGFQVGEKVIVASN
jgi:hypothetical protein